MRFVVATIGAVFIFVALLAIAFVVNAFLPPPLQRPIAVPLGLVSIWATPILFVAIPLALVAAVHSFRSSLKRHAPKDEGEFAKRAARIRERSE
jgi:hypothetical protein